METTSTKRGPSLWRPVLCVICYLCSGVSGAIAMLLLVLVLQPSTGREAREMEETMFGWFMVSGAAALVLAAVGDKLDIYEEASNDDRP